MSRVGWLPIGLCGALAALSCSKPETNRPLGAVPPSAFALVADQALDSRLLGSASGEARRSRAQALVRDELMRRELESLGPERARVVRRGELARQLVEDIEGKLRARGKLSESELKAGYEARWLDFNRPRAVRTVQVFFPVAPPQNDEAQYELAGELLQAVRGTHNLVQFGNKAERFIKMDGVQAYEMPPLTKDGRVVPMDPKDIGLQEISEHLAQAVAKLSAPGDISEIVGTEHGYHVFFVTEVVPEKVVPLDEVREEVERAVFSERVRQTLDGISKEPSVEVRHVREDIKNLLTLVQEGT